MFENNGGGGDDNSLQEKRKSKNYAQMPLDLIGGSCQIEHFSELIHRAWEALGQDYFDGSISSMNRSVGAVIAANGWFTNYQNCPKKSIE